MIEVNFSVLGGDCTQRRMGEPGGGGHVVLVYHWTSLSQHLVAHAIMDLDVGTFVWSFLVVVKHRSERVGLY